MKSNAVCTFRGATANGSPSDSESPRLLSFSFGIPATDGIPFQAFRKANSKKRKLLLETEMSGIKFKGSNFGVDNPGNDFTEFSIGVYDEKAGVMELHRAGHVFAMEQRRDEDAHVPESLSAASMTAMERRQSLTDAFGSKKKKRAMKAAESNIISSQNIVAADTISNILTESVAVSARKSDPAGEEEGASVLSAMDQHRQMMLPHFDATASSLRAAYPLSGGLVPQHILPLLQEWTDRVCQGMQGGGCAEDWRCYFAEDPLCPQTVSELFDQNVSHLSGKEFKKSIGFLILCDAMIRLAMALSESTKPVLKESVEQLLMSPPAPLLRHLADNFAVFKKSFGKSSFASTKPLIDKLLMHTMVLILHLNGGIIRLAAFTKV